jgi:hypothetical protein
MQRAGEDLIKAKGALVAGKVNLAAIDRQLEKLSPGAVATIEKAGADAQKEVDSRPAPTPPPRQLTAIQIERELGKNSAGFKKLMADAKKAAGKGAADHRVNATLERLYAESPEDYQPSSGAVSSLSPVQRPAGASGRRNNRSRTPAASRGVGSGGRF